MKPAPLPAPPRRTVALLGLCLFLTAAPRSPGAEGTSSADDPFAYPASFLHDHAIPEEFTDRDWTRAVSKATSIYEDFLLENRPVDRSVVALNYVTTSENKVDVKVGIHQSWDAIRRAIGAARQSIDITMIGWQVDELVPIHKAETFGFDLIDELCQAARRGVSVNVAVNDMWFKQKAWYLTGGFDRHFDRAVKSGRCQDGKGKRLRYVRGIAWHRGVEVIGRYDHRKVWIFDGEVAFIGGYTVSDEMRDNMYDIEWEIRGPAVAQLQANFLLGMGYQKAPLADFTGCPSRLGSSGCPGLSAAQVRTAVAAYFPRLTAGEPGYVHDLTIVQNNALLRSPDALGTTRFYRHLISSAREYLQLSSPFFTSDEVFARVEGAYEDSRCRLKVDVLFPERPEHMLIWGRKGRKKLRRLVARAEDIKRTVCGGEGEDVVVKAFRGDGTCAAFGNRGRLHGKVLLNESYVTVGSANLDGVSLERNLELNVVSADPELIRLVNERFFRQGASEDCAHTLMFPGGDEPLTSQTPSQEVRELRGGIADPSR